MGLVDSLFNQTITSISSVTPNGYGDPVETVAYTSVKCRWQQKTGTIADKKGQTITYAVEVYMSPNYTVSEQDRFIYQGDTYVVIGVEPHITFSGTVDHLQVYLA